MTDDDYKALVARLRKGGFTVEHLDKAADAIEALMERLDAFEMDGASAATAVKAAEARAERAEALLKEWDALIRHQYNGSSEAMSALTKVAQKPAPPWPQIEKETGRE